jgi:PAS domain S-box-containing protein
MTDQDTGGGTRQDSSSFTEDGPTVELARHLLASVSQLVCCCSADGNRLLFVNEVAEEIYGRPLAELRASADFWLECVHPEDRFQVEQNRQTVMAVGVLQQEFRVTRPDGEIRWLRDRAGMTYDKSGAPRHLERVVTDITELKQVQHSLADSEAVFHSLADSLPLNVLRKDLDGRIAYGNQRYCETVGQPIESLLGKTDFDLFPEELASKYRNDDLLVLESGEDYRDVEEHVTPDGTTIYVEVLKGAVFDKSGDLSGIHCLFWDVTARVCAEQALHRERDLLRTLMDNVPDIIFVKDREGCYLTVNTALQQAVGAGSLDDVVGKNDHDFWPPKMAEHFISDDRKVMESGEALLDFEERLVDADGNATWLLTTKVPLQDANGNVTGLVGIGRDITRRKLDQQNMQRQTLEAKLLYHATTLAAQTSSFKEALQGCIDLVCELTGWPIGHVYLPDEDRRTLVPTPIWHKTEDQRCLKFQALTEQTRFESGVGLPGRIWEQKAPKWIPNVQRDPNFPRAPLCREIGILGALGFPILMEDELVAVLEFFSYEEVEIDDQLLRIFQTVGEQIGRVVKRRRTREALQAAKDAADAANRAKSDFLANMSHEIRTPMNAVIGMAELLMDSPLESSQRDYARMILESGESLLDIINDILDFSKIEAGKLDLDANPFSLQDSLGDTMKSLAQRAHAKHLELAFHVTQDVPEFLVGDAGRLRQVLLNLVGNAIKFTAVGEVVAKVRSVSRTDEDVVLQFSVRDTGTGIPPERVDSIFEAFEQADSSTTRRFGGTGLGLAISSRIVNLMNGQIWVESDVDRGSTFYFTARFKLGSEPVSQAVRPHLDRVAGMRVLIVDDNATNRRILEEVIRARGMKPIVASDASQALRILKEANAEGSAIPLVLSDVNMPDVDGFTMAAQIRSVAELSDVVIIMLTSGDRSSDKRRATDLGIASHLMKPVKQSELFDAIVLAFGITSTDAESTTASMLETQGIERSLRILLAEDAVANQVLAIGLLEKKWNHDVTIANNGNEAMALLATQSFDLVLMDVQMPELDGLEATMAIRQLEKDGGLPLQPKPNIPIVAMTAHAMKGDRERCLSAGMDGYVSKPIRAAYLSHAIEQVCAQEPTPIVPDAVESEVSVDPSAGLINWADALQSVQGDEDLLRTVVEAFLGECPGHVTQLRDAIAGNDAKTSHRLAHLFQGVMMTLGVHAVHETAQQLETICGESDMGQASACFEELEPQLVRVVTALNAYLNGEIQIS